MSLYQNISGTTKPTFRIGPRGIVLSTKDILINKDGSIPKVIKTLVVGDGNNNAAVLTEDNLHMMIPTHLCTKVDQESEPGFVKFTFRYFDEESKKWEEEIVRIRAVDEEATGNVKFAGAAGSVADGEFVAFNGTNGTSIKGSGFSTTDKIVKGNTDGDGNFVPDFDDEGLSIPVDNANKLIPTAKAVTDYIGRYERTLGQRLKGLLDKN